MKAENQDCMNTQYGNISPLTFLNCISESDADLVMMQWHVVDLQQICLYGYLMFQLKACGVHLQHRVEGGSLDPAVRAISHGALRHGLNSRGEIQ